MTPKTRILVTSLIIAVSAKGCLAPVFAESHTAGAPSALLVELFTSEGCSSCPPADDLLREISGHSTSQGQIIVTISEHVSYWDGLGWRDPFSSDVYTRRQSDYGQRFGLASVYTPQMVVNGREQFVGSDRRALFSAFASEAARKQIELHLLSAQMAAGRLQLIYSAADLPAKSRLQLFAALVDDADRSKVLLGENSGRQLSHASVARLFLPLGTLHAAEAQTLSVGLPASFGWNPASTHHLIVFAQEPGTGGVVGIDMRPI